MSEYVVSVSIVAANYNNGKYLTDFISSVLNSTVLPNELIIIDDGSTDNSLEILESYSHLTFLRIIKFENNRGFCEALNAGIKLATGKYILRIDPDDMLVGDRIQKQFLFLESNDEIDVVGSNAIYFRNSSKKYILTSNFPLKQNEIYKVYQKGEHGIQHPTIMVRSVVMKQFKYNQKEFKVEDYDIFARIAKSGHKFANISEPLTKMRIHNDSVTSNITYKTIKRTYQLRDEIFSTSSNIITVLFYYWYRINYRKYLITENKILRLLYLTVSVLFYPQKLFKRIL